MRRLSRGSTSPTAHFRQHKRYKRPARPIPTISICETYSLKASKPTGSARWKAKAMLPSRQSPQKWPAASHSEPNQNSLPSIWRLKFRLVTQWWTQWSVAGTGDLGFRSSFLRGMKVSAKKPIPMAGSMTWLSAHRWNQVDDLEHASRRAKWTLCEQRAPTTSASKRWRAGSVSIAVRFG